ncbi:hypothetical protein CEUSTIGMA_g4344.t1 [Chlamydomonas eustigma]|uniref:Nucleosome assembly protein n=1 Tax=Chlamydomonas eustigma TaxID=1157962 RepID=A0A250X1F3_9CHLO|nr:hypothetical protein CEUSTIGMA_g4344.t1 [Chlamydomonas eustigma]|eukprot:GAX76898.1 hypothetical protein CEUSTIGMA_g4344.t1 [Chlamydomonas eustigma]
MTDRSAKRARTDNQENPEEVDAAALDFHSAQDELNKLNEEASERVLAIEQEYSNLRRPIYEKRNIAISKIPGFWGTTFHHALGGDATEDDLAALSYCSELDVEDFPDIKSGYTIKLKFLKENPYFKNQELVKTYHYVEGSSLKIKSTRPQWCPGYEPQFEAGDQIRSYVFLNWFMSEEDVVESLMTDPIADLIKEEIWPNPFKYYEAESEDMEEEDVEGEFDEGEEDQPGLMGGEAGDEEEVYEGEEGDDVGEEEDA